MGYYEKKSEKPSMTQAQAAAHVDRLLANIDAEIGLLGKILFNPKYIKHVRDILTPEHFYREKHVEMYKVMLSLDQQNRACSLQNVWDELERRGLSERLDMGESDLWCDFADTTETLSPIEEHIENILRIAILRRLWFGGHEIANLALSEQSDALEQAERIIYDIAVGANAKPVSSLSEALDRYVVDLEQRVKDREDGNARGIPTGFVDVDRAIGGLQPGSLYALGALTGVGKSAWALNVALNVVQSSKRALMFTLEMPEGELVQRLLSMETCIDQAFMRDADINEATMRAIKARVQGLRQCELYIDDQTYTLAGIKSKARQLHRQKKLDIIVVDYLQLVDATPEGRSKTETRTEEIAKMSREMKRLARELNVAVVILVQLNRDVERRQSREPQLSDINESGAIARDSNVVMFLYTTPEEIEKQQACTPYQVFLKIAKNRNGRVGEVSLMFAPRITRFRDLAVEEDTSEDDIAG